MLFPRVEDQTYNMKENPWLILVAVPGLLLACGTVMVGVVWMLCGVDAFIASYARVFGSGRIIDLDEYRGLILPLDWLKKKVRAKTWLQLMIRIWLIDVVLVLASGSYFIIAALLLNVFS